MRALPLLEPLAASSRLSGASVSIRALSWAEPTVLVFLGFAAAVLTLNLDLDVRLPGHAILRSVFPFALGLALGGRAGGTGGRNGHRQEFPCRDRGSRV